MQLAIALQIFLAFSFKVDTIIQQLVHRRYIDNCTSHIKDSVDTLHQGNTVNQADQRKSGPWASMTIPAPGTPGSTDGSQCVYQNNGEHLGRRQCDAVTRSDEDRTDTLINGCTVHADGRTQRQNKRRYLSGSTKVLHIPG